MPSAVVGRSDELRTIEDVLDSISQGPAGCVLYGDAGIGKTTLWRAALDAAENRRYTVLSCRPADAEARLSYSSVADLLASVDDATVADLPPPQRDALAAVMLRQPASTGAVDWRTVATAFLNVLRMLLDRTPVVVGIDDFQWLDKTSAQAINFAARRIDGRFGVIVAIRTANLDQFNLHLARDESLRKLKVAPMSDGALHEVVRINTGRSLSKPALANLVRVSGGNPFYAIELVLTVGTEDISRPGTAIPPSLIALTKARLRGVGPDVRNVLVVVSALAAATVDLVNLAVGGDAAGALQQAEDHQIIEIIGPAIHFTHPMLAAGAYALATWKSRREVHRRLATLPLDIEECARHLAIVAEGPEPDTIAALDAAASNAAGRGAPAAASELLDLAIELGATDPVRLVSAARFHFDAGEPNRARTILEELIPKLEPGAVRAEARSALATVRIYDDTYEDAAALLEEAHREATPGDTLAVRIELELTFALYNLGRLEEALAHSAAALAGAQQSGAANLIARALSLWCAMRFLASEPWEQANLDRALQLEDRREAMRVELRPSMIASLIYMWTGRLDIASQVLTRLRTTFLERGAESDLVFTGFHLETLECWRGNLTTARAVADEVYERALQLGTNVPLGLALSARAHSAAYAGEVAKARQDAEESLALLRGARLATVSLVPLATLGFIEVSLDEFEAAANRLAPMVSAAMSVGVREPSVIPFAPDAAEALVRVRRLAEADEVIRWLEENGRRYGRLWAIAVGRRCRSLLLAAQGSLKEAIAECGQALDDHEHLSMPFERARTLLALGQLQRRAGRRRAAQLSLEGARLSFATIGAPLWAAKADRDLARLGIRPTPASLTPSEQRVAELTAAGRTNKQVAAELMISPKTVEANLVRIYQKLDIRSRAELGRAMAERKTTSKRQTPL